LRDELAKRRNSARGDVTAKNRKLKCISQLVTVSLRVAQLISSPTLGPLITCQIKRPSVLVSTLLKAFIMGESNDSTAAAVAKIHAVSLSIIPQRFEKTIVLRFKKVVLAPLVQIKSFTLMSVDHSESVLFGAVASMSFLKTTSLDSQ